jgi:universal stress protein F
VNSVITQKVSSGVTLYADTKTGGFMNRTILVPIDISDSELTQRVISHVEEEAKIDDAEVHFLTVIPSLPYYASLGSVFRRITGNG